MAVDRRPVSIQLVNAGICGANLSVGADRNILGGTTGVVPLESGSGSQALGAFQQSSHARLRINLQAVGNKVATNRGERSSEKSLSLRPAPTDDTSSRSLDGFYSGFGPRTGASGSSRSSLEILWKLLDLDPLLPTAGLGSKGEDGTSQRRGLRRLRPFLRGGSERLRAVSR